MELGASVQEWALALLWGIGAVILYYFFQEDEDAFDDGLGASLYRRKKAARGIFLRLFGGVIRSLGKVIATIPLGNSRAKLQEKLTQAGNPGGLSVDEFHASRIVGIALGAAAGLFLDDGIGTTPLLGLLLGGLGIVYPGIWLNGTIQKRRMRIFRDLPDMLDTLRLAVDAGLDLSSAMKVVVEKSRTGPLLEEMEQVEREIALGRTRREAFRNFADRVAMTEVNAFVIALLQADQLGASIGPILKVQGEMARTRRWQLAEVLVNKMPMKMLGPLVVFIFPSSFIILFTPLLIQWMQAK